MPQSYPHTPTMNEQAQVIYGEHFTAHHLEDGSVVRLYSGGKMEIIKDGTTITWKKNKLTIHTHPMHPVQVDLQKGMLHE